MTRRCAPRGKVRWKTHLAAGVPAPLHRVQPAGRGSVAVRHRVLRRPAGGAVALYRPCRAGSAPVNLALLKS